MKVLHSIAELRAFRQHAGRVVFVPTMGNLHEGHLSLIRLAKQHGDSVIVSIFVNRLQFGVGEDFERYPRTLAQDCAKLESVGTAAVFAPAEDALYPNPQQYCIEPPGIANELCGKFRPGHFRGVTTVVSKLFNIVQPDVAIFGKKDYQQYFVLRDMVLDLNMPIEIIGAETGRAEDGLALSSRNGYLSESDRAEAPRIYRHLSQLRDAVQQGARDFELRCQQVVADLAQHGWKVDYVEVRDAHTLGAPSATSTRLVALIAAKIGNTRLIDNIEIQL
ncbi:pantoate--beta-alanine ligase [Chitinivorax tropicus]|uniref:Pantothenate synthetase n=1 Tax=Chitinivorax tropicus TaxID=714531 RepID=A0A840MLX1_9PROT|nr:pantoate--beta-alanine ligase [Chitinivorax tropicus]MBB5018129.1 pantoate--beta-alanine ligase [Chitinivorax tropicus]